MATNTEIGIKIQSCHHEFVRSEYRVAFEAAFDRVFPNVAARNAQQLEHEDLASFSERLRTEMKPVRDHRNSMVAHAGKPKPATFVGVRRVVDLLDQRLRDLYFVASRGTQMEMTMGGGANSTRFAQAFVDLLQNRAGGPLS